MLTALPIFQIISEQAPCPLRHLVYKFSVWPIQGLAFILNCQYTIERDFNEFGTLFTMSASTSREVLQLYRKLLKYGQELKLTDQTYFCKRVRKEFKTNKNLTSEADIQFNIKVMSFIKIL